MIPDGSKLGRKTTAAAVVHEEQAREGEGETGTCQKVAGLTLDTYGCSTVADVGGVVGIGLRREAAAVRMARTISAKPGSPL